MFSAQSLRLSISKASSTLSMSQNSILDNTLNSLRRRTSLRNSLRLFRTSSKDSIYSNKSTKAQPGSYQPYAVYEQTMYPIILRDPDTTTKLLEAILESPNGRRSLSRLARTCRALSEPALNILWRELDSIVPIIGLFPAQLLKKSRKPGMGLVRRHTRFGSRFVSQIIYCL